MPSSSCLRRPIGLGQSDAEKAKARAAQRARGIALARENNAQVLHLYDRQGKVVATINERDFYNQPTISPDKTRIAVIKNHPETETQDVWVIDVATGKGTRITTASQGSGVVASAGLVSGRQAVGLRFAPRRYRRSISESVERRGA